MSDAGDDSISTPQNDGTPPPAVPVPPLDAYQDALRRYDGALLAGMARGLGRTEPPAGRAALAAAVADRVGEPRVSERLLAPLGNGPKLALTLLAVTEATAWPAPALAHALAALGVDAREAVPPLLELGLVAFAPEGGEAVREFESFGVPERPAGGLVLAHPSALAASRTARPEGALPTSGPVRLVREADGLEPVLRMAVVWQRVAEVPLRQTQQGTLYKRDRDRIEDDPVIAGPIADAIEPLPDMPALWLALARGVGLLESEPGSERITAARSTYWAENAIHLPQMTAARWLGLRTWNEQGGMQREGAEHELALPFLRPALLLWLATLGPDDWVATEDLAAFLREVYPRWDLPVFLRAQAVESPPPTPPRGRGPKARVKAEAASDLETLESLLLGSAYQLGLVRTAEETPTGRRVVQLTPLGRYLLALGPPTDARPAFEHFLFVQPNFEIIAYRQGLTPLLIGQFSRFAAWSQVGAAMALRLTPESVYRGLEGGLTPQAMLDHLARHSPRPLPPGVSEAVRTWAGRRDRVTYHASATLIEFASPDDLDLALRQWPESPRAAPFRVSDRLLLVEDDSATPYHRFRMTGARDYRRPPEVCIEVDRDGVSLTLDLARSDLLVDAELARFADEQPGTADRSAPSNPRRRFVVSADSLARAVDSGMSPAQLSQWFLRRTGSDIPPALRLMLSARDSRISPLSTTRPLVLNVPTAEVLDGLAQHPETRDLLGERLGPTTVVIPESSHARLGRALARLGLSLRDAEPTGKGG